MNHIELTCSNCKIKKPVIEFYKRKLPRWRSEEYSNHCKKCISTENKIRQKKFPWAKCYNGILGRCSLKGFYGKAGIKNCLSVKDIKRLWFRDKAYLMKCPSIDRVDTYGDYTLTNTRFVEFEYNQSRSKRKPTTPVWNKGKTYKHKRNTPRYLKLRG